MYIGVLMRIHCGVLILIGIHEKAGLQIIITHTVASD